MHCCEWDWGKVVGSIGIAILRVLPVLPVLQEDDGRGD